MKLKGKMNGSMDELKRERNKKKSFRKVSHCTCFTTEHTFILQHYVSSIVLIETKGCHMFWFPSIFQRRKNNGALHELSHELIPAFKRATLSLSMTLVLRVSPLPGPVGAISPAPSPRLN